MDYEVRFEISGKVLEVGETQAFGASGFTKRTIIMEGSRDATKYSNPVPLTLKKDATALGDKVGVGDGIRATGYIEGRRWEAKDGSVRYFLDLSVKAIEVTEKAAKPTTAKDWPELLALGKAYSESEDAVKARCKVYGKPFRDMDAGDWAKLAAEIVMAHSGGDAAKASAEPDFDDMPF